MRRLSHQLKGTLSSIYLAAGVSSSDLLVSTSEEELDHDIAILPVSLFLLDTPTPGRGSAIGPALPLLVSGFSF